MTPEQSAALKETAAAILAAAKGEPWQFKKPGYAVWIDVKIADIMRTIRDNFEVRPKSQPTLHWWNCVDDVPKVPVIWIQFVNSQALVTSVGELGLTIGALYSWEEIERLQLPYSTDRKMWQPCKTEDRA